MARTINELNELIKFDPKQFVLDGNNEYYKQIHKVADLIAENRHNSPIVLLSGPSGSGKTTTALTIEKILDESGIETHTLSLDNYFLTITENDQKMLEKGQLDLESPKRVNDEILNEQLEKMIKCESVELPKFDFVNAVSKKSGETLTRKPGELVILEGIHSLNPNVVKLSDELTTKLYVSVRTRVQYASVTMHPSYIRLLRRMIRDKLYRGRSIDYTLKMFDSVEQGEQKYIMPYKYHSDIDIDTFIPYELSVYKSFLLDELRQVENENHNEKIGELVDILTALFPVDEALVPKNSLIREFIGNSEFSY